MAQKKKVEQAEVFRQKKHMKKFGKQVQQAKIKAKKESQKKKMANVEQWKKFNKKKGKDINEQVGKFSFVFDVLAKFRNFTRFTIFPIKYFFIPVFQLRKIVNNFLQIRPLFYW